MNQTKLTALLLSVVLAFGMLSGVAVAEAAVYAPGVYTQSAKGFGGDVQVTVTVDEQKIVSVMAEGSQETEGIGSRAIEQLPDAIVAAGSVNVDDVTGATVTSSAILEAASKALDLASGSEETVKMTPGTYRGSAKGMTGTIVVDVTVSEKAIEKVEFVEAIDKVNERIDPNHWLASYMLDMLKETPQFLQTVVERLPQRIVENQSVNVDVVTGATASSNGFIAAVKDALQQAGALAGAFGERVAKVDAAETYEADVVVIGGGTSGATAAAKAAENGAKVIIIEKSGRLGGTGTVSTEPMTLGGTLMEEAGIQTSVEAMFRNWMSQCHWSINGNIVSKYLNETGTTIGWLTDHGFKFHADGSAGDMTANFSSWIVSYDDAGIGTMGPQTYFNTMCKDIDIILYETTAKSLIVDEAGAVVGVKGEKYDGTQVTVNCKSVIVATGGIGGNDELMMEYMGSTFKPLALTQNMGEGLLMMQEIGAQPYNVGGVCAHQTDVPVQITGFDNYDTSIPYTITNLPVLVRVNNRGERFMDEDAKSVVGATSSTASIVAQGGTFFSLLDQKQYDLLKAEGSSSLGMDKEADPSYYTWPLGPNEPMTNLDAVTEVAMEIGMAFKADTLEELAQVTGMDYAVLYENLAKYNVSCENGYDAYMFKNPAYLASYDLENGPYYAFVGCCMSYGTLGGVKVDEFFRVLDNEDHVIPGLYSAGLDCVGVVMDGVAYPDLRGEALSWGFTSGRLAGGYAAQYAVE